MISKKHRIGRKIQVQCIVVLCLLLNIGNAWAEGSKDLYPVDAKGGRAYLRASTTESAVYPYPTLGTHYVYAEEGEQITLASSAQSALNKRILLYAPDGNEVTLVFEKNNGFIYKREVEVAGPRLPGQRAGESRYIPIYYTVPAGGAGVYRVEFISSSDKTTGNVLGMEYTAAAAAFNVGGGNYLSAWDISVAKKIDNSWNWVTGRVFTTAMALHNPSYNKQNQFLPNSGFYGVFKVLTKDGYVYSVDNNGSQGIAFTFMVNNQGFHKIGDPNTPAYESVPSTKALDIQSRYHDPRKADTDVVVTQKIFYNVPDDKMPEQAVAAMDGGKTWLKVQEKQLHVTDLRVEGAEGGAENQGGKGAYIRFTNENGGEYSIRIKPKNGNTFAERVLQGVTIIGNNKIYWDGKDGTGRNVSAGRVEMQVNLQLHGGEVHFPYIDMELNENGIIIELLSKDTQSVRSDKVYWNDSTIGEGGGNFGSKSNPRNASHTVIPEGISSRVNGHIWGVATDKTSSTFGDEHGIDTWTFIKGDVVSTSFDVQIKEADLEVVAVQSDKEKVKQGEEVTYTIRVKNNGPDAVENATFSFQIPLGFEPVQTTGNTGTCGSESQALAFDQEKNKYTSQVNLANQCEITYTITIKVNNPTVGPIAVEAAILRPTDVMDPDATNQEENRPPTDPHYECEHNGLGIPCNNIKTNTAVRYSEASFILIKEGYFKDINNDGFAQVGEMITYVVKVTNTGKTNISDIKVIDPLLGGVITEIPEKSINADDVLQVGETWVYTLTYILTPADIAQKGVYNLATVKGVDTVLDEEIETTSVPTQPLTPTDPGYDPNRPNHTFVPLKVNQWMIANPMVRQRIR
ncbi:DUF7507 domain-containing protein [Myroides fluvii]|uniref:DUF7507 domain-containing protein n=1 Tax=Myroides fluvii TaxID=2572594 RepID=UPI00131BA05A|nr:DUF11 domain-containing protein [Myroides fluvii]